jgi:hypothetical protein
LSSEGYAALNAAIAAGEVQREPDFEHYIPPRPEPASKT